MPPLTRRQQLKSMEDAANQPVDIDQLKENALQKFKQLGQQMAPNQVQPQQMQMPQRSANIDAAQGRAQALQGISDTDRQLKQQDLDQLDEESQFGELSPEKQARFQQLRRMLSGGQQ